jgi:hypothetical protein
MVDGADKMLDIIAKKAETVELYISKDNFKGSDMLILTEKCDPLIGGGYYLMKEFEGVVINRSMWLCQVTEFVFGEIPERIFIKRVTN